MKSLDAFRREPFFALFTEAELSELSRRSVRKEFAKGRTILAEGDPGNGLYVILAGRLTLVLTGQPDARPYGVLGPGQVIGEISVLDGKPRMATAIAMERSTVLFIARREFEALFAARPQLYASVVAYLCDRLRLGQNVFGSLLARNFPARLASLILSLHQRHALPDEETKLPSLRFSQQEIAALLGISREWVGQELSKWREAGYIDLRRSRLIVRDRLALARMVTQGDSRIANS